MKFRNIMIAIAVSLFIFSCSAADNLMKEVAELSVDVTPEQKRTITKKAKKVQFKKVKSISRSGMDRAALKKGQWVTTLTEMKGGSSDLILTTTKVVGMSGKTVVLETEVYSASDSDGATYTQVTYQNVPSRAKLSYSKAESDRINKKLVVKQMLIKQGEGPVQKMPKKFLEFQRSAGGIVASAVRIGKTSTSKCRTSYIKSDRCITYKIKSSALGKKVVSTVYAHSKVPISGMVKMTSDEMDVTTIAYGYSGARQQIHYRK